MGNVGPTGRTGLVAEVSVGEVPVDRGSVVGGTVPDAGVRNGVAEGTVGTVVEAYLLQAVKFELV